MWTARPAVDNPAAAGDRAAVLPGMETWTPPDYQLDELIGFGSTGEVWRAGAPGGRTVALKRLHRRLDDHAREALVADVERVAAVGSPHLMPVREVLVEAGETVLVLDHAAGGSLAALLARRVLLDAGEVVTIAAPLAGALADAHAAGLVHGAVCPTAVLFTADGMPLLSDLCLGGLRAPERTFLRLAEPAPSPEQDVQDLAALCLQLLTGRARRSGALGNSLAHHPWRPAEECATEADVPPGPVGLLAVLQAVLAADPGERPDAAELARALHSAHPPAPVQLNGPRAAVLPTARPH